MNTRQMNTSCPKCQSALKEKIKVSNFQAFGRACSALKHELVCANEKCSFEMMDLKAIKANVALLSKALSGFSAV